MTGFLVPVGMLPAVVFVTFPAARLAGGVGGCWDNAYLAEFSRWVARGAQCQECQKPPRADLLALLALWHPVPRVEKTWPESP